MYVRKINHNINGCDVLNGMTLINIQCHILLGSICSELSVDMKEEEILSKFLAWIRYMLQLSNNFAFGTSTDRRLVQNISATQHRDISP